MEKMVLVGPDWFEWKRHPQTQEFLKHLRASVQTAQDCWLNNEFVSEDAHKSTILNAAAIAGAQVCSSIVQAIEDIQFGDNPQKEEA